MVYKGELIIMSVSQELEMIEKLEEIQGCVGQFSNSTIQSMIQDLIDINKNKVTEFENWLDQEAQKEKGIWSDFATEGLMNE